MKTELITKDYLKYKDLMDKLATYDKKYFAIGEFYTESGVVYISGHVKANVDGYTRVNVIPYKYAPRKTAYGFVNCDASSTDVGKVNIINAETNGDIYVWTNKLNYNEIFTIQYPLKVE